MMKGGSNTKMPKSVYKKGGMMKASKGLEALAAANPELTYTKKMYGGMANKKKHNYTAGGSVQDNLGVMIAVGKLKPKKKNGSKTT